MARVVMACALKHHTRRGERDPERWQLASQLVTHALIRDAGFTLPPDAEAWEEVSVEQAYDRLPEPGDDDSGDDAGASSGAAADASADGQPSPDGEDEDSGDPTDSSGDKDRQDEDGDSQPNGEDGDDQDGDGQGQDGNDEGDEGTSDAPPSHDPSGTGEVMDADARARDGGDSAEAPVDITAEEQAWDEAMHQALNIARAEGKVPGQVEETVQGAHASTLDWRTLLRRYMTDTAKRDYTWSQPNRRFIDSGLYLPAMHSEAMGTIVILLDTSGSIYSHLEILASFWTEVREVAHELNPERASSSCRSTPASPMSPSTRARTSPRSSKRRAGAGRTSGPGSHGSTPRASSPRAACTSRTWSARATPRPSRPSMSCSAITARRRRSGTASPGASASTSPPDIRRTVNAPLRRAPDHNGRLPA